MDQCDVIVVGAGNAGQGAAGVLRAAGRSVVLVEERDVGGTCPLRGCVPKKVLVATAEALDLLARAGDLGIDVDPPRPSWERMMARKRSILAGTSASMTASLTASGVQVVAGSARFSASDTLQVGERELRAEHIVLATGSTPRPLELPGAEHLLTSEQLLELPAAPADAIFVGGGPISFEFAHVLARIGTRCTVLEVGERPLATLDADLSAQVVAATSALGVVVHSGVQLRAIEPRGERFAVRFVHEGREQEATAAAVFHGAGRVPALASLDLDRGGVATAHGAVITDGFRSRSNPRVRVAGDALHGTPQLSPVATYEGKLVGRAILGEEVAGEYGAIPGCVYTVPTAASVGLTEEQARQRGLAVTAHVNDMTGWRSGRSYAERFAWAKVLLDADDHIVGAHLCGHGAGETIHLFALAMKHRLPARTLREMVWAYPTFASDVTYLV